MLNSSAMVANSSVRVLKEGNRCEFPGLGQPNAYIALPVSPRFLFIAAHDSGIAQTVRETNPTEIVRKNNRSIIQQARKFVWGSNDAQLKFIQRNFGKLPDREILTAQQRQQAIEPARGKIGLWRTGRSAEKRELGGQHRPGASHAGASLEKRVQNFS